MWADRLHHLCCLKDPQRFGAADKVRFGPTCGQLGYITLLSQGSPTLQSGR